MEVTHFTNVLLDMVAISIILILLLTNLKRKVLYTFDQRLYNFLLLSNGIITIIDAITWLVDKTTFTGSEAINSCSNGLLYGLAPVLGLTWALYVDSKVFNDEEGLKRRIKFYLIPLVINFIVSIVSIYHEIYFTILDNNEFSRNNPFCYIPFALAIVYAIYADIIIIKNKTKLSKSNYFSLLLYMFIPIICTFIQMSVYGLALIYCGFALSMIIIYVNVQNEMNVTDYLTGLSNRRHLEIYLTNELNRIKSNETIYGIMIDIDNFKGINDKYGHIEGDHALEIVSKILRKGIRSIDFVCRYAGDEFVIIAKITNDENINSLIENIEKEKKEINEQSNTEYNIDFSIGYTSYISNERKEDFINRMDNNMYLDKTKKKELYGKDY